LRRGPALVPVEPQVFDLLLFLVTHRDRVVSKEDVLASVWAGRIVSEATIASRINAARRVIGDDGGQQRLIRTITRKGIRFVGSVQEQQTAEVLDSRGRHQISLTMVLPPPITRPSLSCPLQTSIATRCRTISSTA
jgi:DNA-binding winged helix-turn-helix (wHTH) protein